MLLKKKSMGNSGFSLVELMVVVAIIGVLAAIAVPNVNRYIAKSRQSEAKSNLSALYSAEKTFFTEYNTYYDGFMTIGYAPEGKLRYNVGFGSASGITLANLNAKGYTPSVLPTGDTFRTGTAGAGTYCGTAPNSNNNCSVLSDSGAVPSTAILTVNAGSSNAFIAGACGKVNASASTTGVTPYGGCAAGYDAWTIDAQKALTNNLDGTK